MSTISSISNIDAKASIEIGIVTVILVSTGENIDSVGWCVVFEIAIDARNPGVSAKYAPIIVQYFNAPDIESPYNADNMSAHTYESNIIVMILTLIYAS